MRAILVVLLTLAALLSGCADGEFSNGPDGQSASTNGHLAYNGASTGTQQGKATCKDGSGKVSFSANLGSGKVTVRAVDASGVTQFTDSWGNVGQHSQSKSVSGAKGDWTLVAERSAGSAYGASGWSGQYDLTLVC